MSAPPHISIITPAYNASAYFHDTIASVLAQKYSDWEWLIIDDCSTDNTRDILQALAIQDNRIRVCWLDKNQGVAYARSHAVTLAQGRYTAFLDADDLWSPDKLSLQLDFMQETLSAFSYTAYHRVNESRTVLGATIRVPQSLKYKQLLGNTAIATSTVMIDRTKIKDITFPNIPYEDFAAWLSILKTGIVAHGLDKDLMTYRVRVNSLSSNKWEALHRVWNIYRNIEKIPTTQSCFYMLGYIVHAVMKRRRSLI